jgi:hypothetical protein
MFLWHRPVALDTIVHKQTGFSPAATIKLNDYGLKPADKFRPDSL